MVDDGIMVRTGELNAAGDPIYTSAPEYQGMDESALVAVLDAYRSGGPDAVGGLEIQFARKMEKTPPPTPRQQDAFRKDAEPIQYEMDQSTKIDDAIYQIDDQFIDVQRLVETIEEHVGQLPDRLNPILQETAYAGKAEDATNHFLHDELRPLQEEMKTAETTTKALDEYLRAKTAKTANARLQEINPKRTKRSEERRVGKECRSRGSPYH